MKEAKIELVNQTDSASLYTITFGDDGVSEFEKFINKFKDNATLQRDYQLILLALEKSETEKLKLRKLNCWELKTKNLRYERTGTFQNGIIENTCRTTPAGRFFVGNSR